jgi:hypothetical protein
MRSSSCRRWRSTPHSPQSLSCHVAPRHCGVYRIPKRSIQPGRPVGPARDRASFVSAQGLSRTPVRRPGDERNAAGAPFVFRVYHQVLNLAPVSSIGAFL